MMLNCIELGKHARRGCEPCKSIEATSAEEAKEGRELKQATRWEGGSLRRSAQETQVVRT